METMNQTSKQHKMILNNRKNCSLTGILDVLSFDTREVLLETELGMLTIKGQDLHVNRLSVEKGEVDLDGHIDSYTYTETSSFHAKGESLFSRLFK